MIKNNYYGNNKDAIMKLNAMERDHKIELLTLQNTNNMLLKENEILQLKLMLATK
jgi:hypothetical protein